MESGQAQDFSVQLGQLFMVGLPGAVLDSSTLHLIETFGINNFIYFKRNVESPEQLKALSADLSSVCLQNGLGLPLIAIDQEGGTVTRLGPPFTQFPDARVLAQSENPEAALKEYSRTCAGELKSIGVNYNLAPVLDICEEGIGCFMERRVLGSDPGTAARLGALVVRELQDNGIAACGKHFPGLGAAVVDPHFDLPRVASAESDIRARDLLPFREAIRAGVASIMTSHTIYENLDPECPATLSKKILTGLLRNELGYDNVVITDDLEMGAIEEEGDLGEGALQALEAGADILLICHSHEKVIAAHDKTGLAVSESAKLQQRVKKSFQRVSLLKAEFAKSD